MNHDLRDGLTKPPTGRHAPKSPEHRAKIAASNRITKRARAVPILHRFRQKVVVDATTGCWNWQASKDQDGYALFTVEGKTVRAFRWLYQELFGQIGIGLVPDHLCRNRGCVNPLHAEIVTNHMNTMRGESPSAKNARKTHCDRGHEFTDTNTFLYKERRLCRTCRRIDALARYHRRKGRSA